MLNHTVRRRYSKHALSFEQQFLELYCSKSANLSRASEQDFVNMNRVKYFELEIVDKILKNNNPLPVRNNV